MTKSSILTLIFFCVIGPSIAQQLPGFFSGEIYSDSTSGLAIISRDEKDLYCIRDSGPNFWLDIYSIASLTKTESLSMNNELATIGKRIKKYGLINGNFVFFYITPDEKNKLSTLNAYVVKKGNTLTGTTQQLSQAPITNKYFFPIFDLSISPDLSKILISTIYFDNTCRCIQTFYTILNTSLEVINQKKFTQFEGSQYVAVKSLIDNVGNIHLLATPVKASLKSYKIHYRLFVLFNDDSITSMNPGLTTEYISNYAITSNGEFAYGAGFYGTKGNESMAGSFCYGFNMIDKKILYVQKNLFSKNIVGTYLTPKEMDKGELISFTPKNLFVMDDMSITMISEFQAGQSKEPYFNTQYQMKYGYINKDVLVMNFSKEGKVNWSVNIPKNQELTPNTPNFSADRDDHNYFGIVAACDRKKVFILYNDHESNLTKSRDQIAMFNFLSESTRVILATIDSAGTLSKNIAPLAGDGFAHSQRLRIFNKSIPIPTLNNELLFFQSDYYKYRLVNFKF